MKIALAHFLVNEQLPQFFVACFHAFHLSKVCRINLTYIIAQARLLFNIVSYTSGEYDRFAGIARHLGARQKKQLNLRAVRATIPTPHSEDKLIGGQMMNYEVNSFQNYESITIDELKDQANSLLNLVTEEQRPLRVCMNNGKEFLLFPQDLLAPICDSDFRLILLSAMRYAMGRNTCMPMVVADYIKRHIQLLDDKFLVLAADEIRRHLEDYAEHEPNPNLWHDLLGALETEQRERATRKARKIRLCPACGKPLEVMSIADNQHSPGGFDVIAHCRNCLSDYEWFCDKDGGVSDMKQYFFG